MGYGDEIIATGIAKRNFDTFKKKTAFGINNRLITSQWTEEIFRHNPKIVKPGDPLTDVIWSSHCKGSRDYVTSHQGSKFNWKPDFVLDKGEFFFTDEEEEFGLLHKGRIILEPNTAKIYGDNRRWKFENFQKIADMYPNCAQFDYGSPILKNVKTIKTPSIRHAAAVLKYSSFLISLHGGLQYAAAAVDCPGVIIFGEFVNPDILGYSLHINLFNGTGLGCGKWQSCNNCHEAMNKITVEHVIEHIPK